MNKEFIKDHIFIRYKEEFTDLTFRKAETFDVSGIICREMTERLNDYLKVDKKDRIHLRINSPGGDAFAAMACINLLTNSGKNITTELLGMAASCAADLFLLGTDRIVHPMGAFLIHKTWMPVAGNASELRKIALQLEEIDNQFMREIYLPRLKATKEELNKLLEEDRFMTKDEMQNFGVYTMIKKDKNKDENMKESSKLRKSETVRLRPNPKLKNFSMEVRKNGKYE